MTTVVLALSLGLIGTTGCAIPRTTKLPGETDIHVAKLTIEPRAGTASIELGELPTRLGLRPPTAILGERYYNPFQVAEDRRRVAAYLGNLGYFNAVVDQPEVVFSDDKRSVSVRIVYDAGPHFELVELGFKGVPSDVSLTPYLVTETGSDYNLEFLRLARYEMAAELQRAGYGHGKVFVRNYLDRDRQQLHVIYFADPGPLTTIGTITIDGNHKVSEADIRRRLGLAVGEPYSLARRQQAEADLLDTSSFASAYIEANVDVDQFLGESPDTGGIVPDDRIDDQGDLLPRQLPTALDLIVHVNEAPRTQVRLRATAEADITRVDITAGARVTLRDTPASQNHFVLDGRVGYGLQWRGDDDEVTGLYGDALLQYSRPGLIGRLGDVRASIRFRDVLYPGASLRELTAGPGIRSTLAPGLFVDFDVYARAAQQVDFGSFDDATRTEFSLPDDNDYLGAEAAASLVLDKRNDPVEPSNGYFLAARALISPIGSARYLQLAPEFRFMHPVSTSWSFATRASLAWTFELGDDGVPLGPRLFGGGAWGMRGFGRDKLSPVAAIAMCDNAPCGSEYVGGLSLAEASLEMRYLPYRKQIGLTLWADFGGTSLTANPFADGINVAAGIGPRVRLWYLPVSIDVGYRFVDHSDFTTGGVQAFVRIGEAF